MIERMPGEAQESSAAWNNAGTGHAANCELNYTPQRADGSVDIAKALEVNTEFDLSRQFWSYLIKKGAISSPGQLHPFRAAHELRDRRRSPGVPQEAARRDEQPSLLSRHGVFGGPRQDRRMGAAGHGRPRSQTADRRDTHRERRRRQLRRAHHQPDEPPEEAGPLRGAFLADGDEPAAPPGRRLAAGRQERGHRRKADGRHALRLPGRRRCRPHAAAEVGHSRGQGLRGLPGERHLAALRQARDRRSSCRQGLRHGGRRLAAHVGAPSRHAHHRRQALGAVRALCRLLDQVPEARLVVRPAAVAPARQFPAAAGGGAGQFPARGDTWSARSCRPRAIATRRCASSIPT